MFSPYLVDHMPPTLVLHHPSPLEPDYVGSPYFGDAQVLEMRSHLAPWRTIQGCVCFARLACGVRGNNLVLTSGERLRRF